MKKTLTVNLGGTVFHIDEDAYQLLDKYLTNLREHFKREEGSDEIMNDFELRISELLNARVRLGFEVITIENIEEVIKRMGKPEEIFASDEDSENKEEQKAPIYQETKEATDKKQLMRDPDNRILGGVAAGIAAYMNWDATAVRLIMILLLFIPHSTFFVTITYIICWLVMPQAKSATDKLRMHGQSVTVENIGKTVTDGFEKVSNKMNDFASSDKPRNGLQRLGDVVVTIFGFLLKFIAILVGVILLPVLLLVVFVLVVVAFALMVGGTGILYHLSPFGSDVLAGAPLPLAIMGCIGVILLIGIPVFSLLYAICTQLFKIKPLPVPFRWTLLGFWIVSLILCGIYVYQMGISGINTLPWYNIFTV